ncbi:MAG: Serine/threonine-protein kinase pkn1 [Candidatus Accumulibacter phosphatis]|uniref:Serine/threonine-protein kinase pkn1 n=1 Tax=Candidatus Accumulibacter phosphatis TaxID=327160 RepID=A0A080LTD7_9PROT|nr:formylglycine-generating enzyme family protein [Accumulibacter sp.]KFB70855.1 MAG: Serine/threonine-protein kinase pkn1 [Candidatus Accumulibacter phosphatis]
MSSGKPVATAAFQSLLRRLDYLPGGLGMALGLGAGALLGGGVALASPLVAVGGFVALLGLAVALAFSGEPITVIDSPAEPEGGRGVGEAPNAPPAAPAMEAIPVLAPPIAGEVAMVSIPGGTFLMGSPDDEAGRGNDEGPVHEQRIAAFECMPHPVTRRLYREWMGKDPGWPEGEADERPVNNVSWYDALAFCNELSKRAGLAPCYRLDAPSRAEWDQAANGYRLPTEAEWEYACRAGSRTRYSFGDDQRQLAEHAWYADNSGNVPHPVGQKEPNRWGLHDMHGNVWEWCWSDYEPYPSKAGDRPIGATRVLRGGSFGNPAVFLRSAYRVRFRPENRGQGIGFRCVRGPRRQP